MKMRLCFLVSCLLLFNAAKPQANLSDPETIKLYVYFVTSHKKVNINDSSYAYNWHAMVQLSNRRKLSGREVFKKFGSDIFADRNTDSIFVDAEYPFLDDLKENSPDQYKKIDSLLKRCTKYKTDPEMAKFHLARYKNNDYRYSVRQTYAEWYELVIDSTLAAYILGSDLFKSSNQYDPIHLFMLKKEFGSKNL